MFNCFYFVHVDRILHPSNNIRIRHSFQRPSTSNAIVPCPEVAAEEEHPPQPRRSSRRSHRTNYCYDSEDFDSPPANKAGQDTSVMLNDESCVTTRSGMEKWAVFPLCYPLCHLTEEDFKQINVRLEAIMTRDMQNDIQAPLFDQTCYLFEGCMVFPCRDMYTISWLNNVVEENQRHRGMTLAVSSLRSVRKSVTVVAEFSSHYTSWEMKSIQHRLMYFNRRVSTLNIIQWRAIKNVIQNSKRRVWFAIPAEDLEELTRLEMRLHLGLTVVEFQARKLSGRTNHKHEDNRSEPYPRFGRTSAATRHEPPPQSTPQPPLFSPVSPSPVNSFLGSIDQTQVSNATTQG